MCMEIERANLKTVEIKNMILNGYKLELKDLQYLKIADLDLLSSCAREIKEFFSSGNFELCTIINAKSGKCSEDCSFCAQSSYYDTDIESYNLLDNKDILKSAIDNYENGVNRFSIVTSGRKLSDSDLEISCKSFEMISSLCPIELCSSNGLLNFEQLKKLKDSGVSRYHNNLESSRSFFPNICSTHSYDEKIETIKAAQKAGLSVCSGLIFGLGESIDDRIDAAFTLRDLNVDSIPINLLNPIKNTPLANNKILEYEDFKRSLAIYRFILADKNIRLAGGRVLLPDKGKSAIECGVDSMISGEMLTTSGIKTSEDINMLHSLGLSVKSNNTNLDIDHIDNISEVLLKVENNEKDSLKSSSNSIFISGTNTDIGKTFISSKIVNILSSKNISTIYYKAILSGAYGDSDNLIAGDCQYLVENSHLKESANELVSYVFKESYSPHLAAKVNNCHIEVEKILNDFKNITENMDYCVIEGCGGIVCTLYEYKDTLFMQTDLIKELNTDVLLVSPSGLGSINAAISSYEHCINNGISVRAIIMNNFDRHNIIHINNKKMIEKISKLRVFFMEEEW